MNVESRVFPSVMEEWPFQDHLHSRTIESELCLPKDLNNECAEQISSQGHQQMYSLRPSSE